MATFVGQIMVKNMGFWGTLCSQPNYLLNMVSPHFCGDILQRFRLVKPLYENGRNRGTTNQRGILYSQSTISMGKKWFWGPLNAYGYGSKSPMLDASKIDMTSSAGFLGTPFFYPSNEGNELKEIGMGWAMPVILMWTDPGGCLACQPPGRIQVSIIRFFCAHVM